MGKNYKFEFNDLDDFYKECTTPEPFLRDIDTRRLNDHLKEDSPYFRGKNLKEIEEIKYGYTKGVDSIEEIEQDFAGYGASKFTFKWNDVDGEDMNMERAYEGMPYLKQRRRSAGNGTGRFVTIDIVIGENCDVDSDEMMQKARTAIVIANRLETLGFRVALNALTYSYGVGYFDKTSVDYLTVIIPIKKFEDPVNLPLMLNCVSPWFFRYWVFAFFMSKFHCSYGLGQARTLDLEDTRERILINTGECLTKHDSEARIKKISKLFNLAEGSVDQEKI